jgi:hypothetical protein
MSIQIEWERAIVTSAARAHRGELEQRHRDRDGERDRNGSRRREGLGLDDDETTDQR